jgi:hypothetical protein
MNFHYLVKRKVPVDNGLQRAAGETLNDVADRFL